ncbi:Conserved hypothetical protein CHP03086 [Mycolicibacterium rhodesiae JS60]|nr:Conserved hypothetical protein CHP03086 [Mycolicibacterium rhodesiae JS60]
MYRLAAGHAAAVIETIRPDQLCMPTPCSLWTVHDLLDHLIGGTEYLLAAVARREAAGATRGDARDFRDGVARVIAELEQHGVLTRTCQSPIGFEWSVEQAVAGTALDLLIHTWDLARATGQDETLDPTLVTACSATFLPHMPEAGRVAGLIGPAIDVDPDAGPQDLLLAAMGRRP